MKLLLHICCAPCSIYPVKKLRKHDMSVMGFFFKNNIHPYTECLKREDALRAYVAMTKIDVIYQQGYDMEGFLQKIVFRESERCTICYSERLKAAALIAKKGNFDYFSTTLLYSKFQKHDMIRSVGESIGKSIGVPFYYHDFREGWKEGIAESKRLELYRQQYCGCIYSEKERFFKNNHE